MTRATLDFSPAAEETILMFHRDGSITVGGKWRDCPDEAAQAIIASLELKGWTRQGQQWLHDGAPMGKDYEIYRLRSLLQRAWEFVADAAAELPTEGNIALRDEITAVLRDEITAVLGEK